MNQKHIPAAGWKYYETVCKFQMLLNVEKNMNPKFEVLSLDLLVYISPCPLLSHFKTSMDDIFASSYVESKQ